jgi:hypothetical protein
MGITQQIGASSLIKPGVIDNTAARPASPYEGQVIFQKDTDQLLVWNGTAWVIPNSPTQNPMGLEFITTGTLTTSGIDGIFTSTYDNYRILLTNVTTSGGALLNFNYRTTANATDSTNTYYSAGRRFDNGTNYDFSQGANTYGTTALNCEASGGFGSMVMDIFSPRLTLRTISSINGMGQISQISTVQASTLYNATTSFAGIIFSSSAYTISGGTYTVYGYRKAA